MTVALSFGPYPLQKKSLIVAIVISFRQYVWRIGCSDSNHAEDSFLKIPAPRGFEIVNTGQYHMTYVTLDD